MAERDLADKRTPGQVAADLERERQEATEALAAEVLGRVGLEEQGSPPSTIPPPPKVLVGVDLGASLPLPDISTPASRQGEFEQLVASAVVDWLRRAGPRVLDDCHIAKLELTLTHIGTGPEAEESVYNLDLDETFPQRALEGSLVRRR